MNTRSLVILMASAVVCMAFVSGCASACSSAVKGTYSDAMGAVILELKAGGKANLTLGDRWPTVPTLPATRRSN